MRANTFAGQIVAVLSRRASAFARSSGEPQTFPGRLRALLSPSRHTPAASLTSTDANPVTASEKPKAKAPETAEPPAGDDAAPAKQQGLEASEFDFGIVRALAHELSCRKPDVRLRVRAHAAFIGLEHSLQRGRHDLAESLDLAVRNLNLIRDFTHARDLALDLDHALRNSELDLTRIRDLIRNLRNLDLNSDFAHALHNLDATSDLAHTLHNLDLDSAAARELHLDHALARYRDLTHLHTRGANRDHVLDLTRTRGLIRELDYTLARNFALDRDRDSALARASRLDHDLTRYLTHDLNIIRDFNLDAVLADLDDALADLDDALHDFTTADLRDVDLTSVPLAGLRWSSATRWPADWASQVARTSVEVAPDVFEVRGDNNTRAPMSV